MTGRSGIARLIALTLLVLTSTSGIAAARPAAARYTAAALSRDLVYSCASEVRGAVAAIETDGAMSEFWTDASPRPHPIAKATVAYLVTETAGYYLKDPRPLMLHNSVETYAGVVRRDRASGRDMRFASFKLCLWRRLTAIDGGAPLQGSGGATARYRARSSR